MRRGAAHGVPDARRLDFRLTAPNAFVFVSRFAKVAGIATTPRSTTELLAHYLVELTLQEYKMLKYLPSTICASAVYLALKTCGHTPWTADLERHSTYKEADLLQACVRDIHELHAKASTGLQAVRRKYAHKKYASVSSIRTRRRLLLEPGILIHIWHQRSTVRAVVLAAAARATYLAWARR